MNRLGNYLQSKRKKAIPLILIVCVTIMTISFVFYYNNELKQQAQNSLLISPSISVGDFAVYKQDYTWLGLNGSESEVRYVFWNVTSTNDSIANVQVLYYWIKGPSNNLTFPEVQKNITVSMDTREILNYSNQSDELPFGSIFPYWISPYAKYGDKIGTSYGQSTVYQAEETIDALNLSHDCWLINDLFTGNDSSVILDRFYDKTTGFCLETRSGILITGTMITLYETLFETNIIQLN